MSALLQGLVKNRTLKHLSFEFCRIADSGVQSKCLKVNVSNIFQLMEACQCLEKSFGFNACKIEIKQSDCRNFLLWVLVE